MRSRRELERIICCRMIPTHRSASYLGCELPGYLSLFNARVSTSVNSVDIGGRLTKSPRLTYRKRCPRGCPIDATSQNNVYAAVPMQIILTMYAIQGVQFREPGIDGSPGALITTQWLHTDHPLQ